MPISYLSEKQRPPYELRSRGDQSAFGSKWKGLPSSKAKAAQSGVMFFSHELFSSCIKNSGPGEASYYKHWFQPETRQGAKELLLAEYFEAQKRFSSSESMALQDWELSNSQAYKTLIGLHAEATTKRSYTELAELHRLCLAAIQSKGHQQLESEDAQAFLEYGRVSELGENEAAADEPSLAQLLDELADPQLTTEKRNSAIYAGELLPVSIDLRVAFLSSWKDFILRYRDTQDSSTLSAVMCAIRKYVAEMPAADLPEISFLIDPKHSVTMPVELDLTVAKMIVRKLTANPPKQENPYPELSDQLWLLVQDYLRDRFLSRKYFGAVAIESVVALLMCCSPYTENLLYQLKGLSSRWFVEATSDFIEETIGQITQRNPSEVDGPTTRALQAAVGFLGVMQPART